MVDTRDLKSLGQKWLYEFESRPRHLKNATALCGCILLFFSLKNLDTKVASIIFAEKKEL